MANLTDQELKQVQDALDRAIETEKRSQRLVESIAPAVVQALSPILSKLAETMVQRVDVRPEITMPEMPQPIINVPAFDIPTPKVTVKMPAQKIPKPTVVIRSDNKTLLKGLNDIKKAVIQNAPLPFELPKQEKYTFTRPMPVLLVDASGKPSLDFQSGGGGGGKSVVALKDANGTPISSANPLPISGSFASTPFLQISGAVDSMNVVQIAGNAIAAGAGVVGLGVQRIVLASDVVSSIAIKSIDGFVSTSNSTTTPLAGGGVFTGTSEDMTNYAWIQVNVFSDQASATDGISMQQSSDGTNWDITDVYTVAASTGKVFSVQPGAKFFRVVYTNGVTLQGSFRLQTIYKYVATKASSQRAGDGYSNETDLEQNQAFPMWYNGVTWDRARNGSGTASGALRVVQAVDVVSSVFVNGFTSTVGATLSDSSGVGYSGSNPLPITGPVVVTSITNTVAANISDSSGVGYSGSNPLPISGTVTVSGSPTSTIAVGAVVAGAADDGSAPLKEGGIARTTNPSAVTDGQRVSASYDKLGRALTRPMQMRDNIATAYATLSNGTETTLLAGIAATFLDPIMVTGTNTSTAAVQVDLRCGTGGNIVMTWMIPASTGPIGLALPVPWPQDATGNSWTIDMGDFTNTNLYFSGLFTKEL